MARRGEQVHHSMASLMVSSLDLVLFSDHARLGLGTHHDLVLGPFKVLCRYFLVLQSRGMDSGLIAKIFQISTRHATGASGKVGSVNFGRERHGSHMML